MQVMTRLYSFLSALTPIISLSRQRDEKGHKRSSAVPDVRRETTIAMRPVVR